MPKKPTKKTASEGQKLLKRLQTKYTNKEIATLLDYKSSSSVSAISNGKQKLPTDRLEKLRQVVDYTNPRKKPASASELKRLRNVIRKNRKAQPLNAKGLRNDIANFFGWDDKEKENWGEWNDYTNPDDYWKTSNIGAFLGSINSFFHDLVMYRLSDKQLDYVYHNTHTGDWLLSNRWMSTTQIDGSDVTGFMSYVHMETVKDDGTVKERRQVSIFPLGSRGIKPEGWERTIDLSLEARGQMEISVDEKATRYGFLNFATSETFLALVSLT